MTTNNKYMQYNTDNHTHKHEQYASVNYTNCGNWRTHGYTKSQTANSQTSQLADWISHGLDSSWTSQVAI